MQHTIQYLRDFDMTINKTKLTVCVAVFILIISGIAYGETECDVIAKNYLAFLGSLSLIHI